MMKMLKTREKMSKIQDLKDERDRIMNDLLQGKKENELLLQQKMTTAKNEYEARQNRKMQQAYQSYVRLKEEREVDKKEKEARLLQLSKDQNRLLVKNFQQAEQLRSEFKQSLQSRQMN